MSENASKGADETRQQAAAGDATPVVSQAQLEEALREREQFRALAQRALADLANYKRRAEEEREEARRHANFGLLLKLLDVVDNLHRAVAMIPEDAVAPGWLEGLRLLQRNIEGVVEAEGVARIDAIDRAFEPWQHEAVSYMEAADGTEAGKVLAVVREGYRLHDRVLRAAQVVVSSGPPDEARGEPTQQE